jgi:hypothetical protein
MPSAGASSDASAYLQIARRIVAGEGYFVMHGPRRLLAWRPPGYPFLLAGGMGVFGDVWRLPTAMNLLFYTLTMLVLFDLVRRVIAVALAGAPGGLLRAPPDGLAGAADVTGMVGNPILKLHHRGDPPTGPQLSPNATRCGPPLHEFGQAGELLGREPARGAGRRMVAQSIGALLSWARFIH